MNETCSFCAAQKVQSEKRLHTRTDSLQLLLLEAAGTDADLGPIEASVLAEDEVDFMGLKSRCGGQACLLGVQKFLSWPVHDLLLHHQWTHPDRHFLVSFSQVQGLWS